MIGAFIGDTIGSSYEGDKLKTKDFELYTPYTHPTDDSVLTFAIEEALMKNYPLDLSEEGILKLKKDTLDSILSWVKANPKAGYGTNFIDWVLTSKDHKPYNSYGNGSAMRVSPVPYVCKNLEEVKIVSRAVTEITHNHIEGIKGAEAIAVSIYLSLHGKSKEEIKDYIVRNYYQELEDMSYNKLIKHYEVSVTCQGSVPQAICCFLESKDFEDALRSAISIGGDTDTIACMTCAIAEAYYQNIPPYIQDIVEDYFTKKMKDTYLRFNDFISKIH